MGPDWALDVARSLDYSARREKALRRVAAGIAGH
jgi:hypothetical protein